MTRLSGFVSDMDGLAARLTDFGRRISALERRGSVQAVRYFTAGSSGPIASNATYMVPFNDNAGNSQGDPGIGNPANGRATFAAPGIYQVGVRSAASTSFNPVGSGITLNNNGTSVASVPINGAWATPSASFTFVQLKTASPASLEIGFFNNTAAPLTINYFQIVVARVAPIRF